MTKILYTERFLRTYKKLVMRNSRLQNSFLLFEKKLKKNPFYPALKTHKINTHQIGEAYSSRVTGDLRVLWKFTDEGRIIFITVGGHSGKGSVYK